MDDDLAWMRDLDRELDAAAFLDALRAADREQIEAMVNSLPDECLPGILLMLGGDAPTGEMPR